MFFLRVKGEKFWISKASILQANHRQYISYVAVSLQHTAFCVFIAAPFTHEFYSLKHSEQCGRGNNAHSIIHSVLNFISFALKKTTALQTPSPCTTHTTEYKVQKNLHALFLLNPSSQTQVKYTNQIHKHALQLNIEKCQKEMVKWFPRESVWIWLMAEKNERWIKQDWEPATFYHSGGRQGAEGQRIVSISEWWVT